MPKQENTAINDLIGLRSTKPIDTDEPALFGTVPPAARLRPPPFGGSLAPIGASVAPLPRRRAPAATPPQVPLYADYDDDAATTFDPPRHADTGPFVPPLPQPPYVPPIAVYSYAQPVARPAYPPPNQPPAYYQAPYADHLETVRVRSLPLDPDPSLGSEILAWVAKLWIPFVALGVIAIGLSAYRLLAGDAPAEPARDEAPIVMTTEPAPVAELAAAPVPEQISAEPEVPKDSLWQPTTPQPTLVAPSEPSIDVEPAAEAKPAARASVDRSSRSASRRAKRAAAKRAKQVTLAEVVPVKTPKPAKAERSEKVVEVIAAKPMKIGATTVAPAKGSGGAGKLTVTTTPPTLIYVDGRNTGMMTPKTLSLPEGSHKITMLSPKDRIAKTVSVDIAAGSSAKLTKDFTK